MPPTPFRPASRDIPLPQGTSTPSIDKSETVLRERRRSLRSTPQTEEEPITTNKNNSPDVFHPSTPFVPCRDVEAAEHWQDWEKPVSGLGFYDFKKGKVIPRSVPDADASSSIHACIADQGPSELWLRGQNLTALHSDIGSLHQLVILDVSHNWLQRLPEELKHCGSHLRILNCSYNCLIELCPKSLGSLIALEELDCSHNLLPEVPPAISSLSRLTTLRLNSNKLKRLPFNVGLGLASAPGRKLSSLTLLDLSHNLIDSLPESFARLGALKTLDLSQNQLSALPKELGGIHGLHSLTSLDLCFNHFEDLPQPLMNLASLKYLDTRNNVPGITESSLQMLNYLPNAPLTPPGQGGLTFPTSETFKAQEVTRAEERAAEQRARAKAHAMLRLNATNAAKKYVEKSYDAAQKVDAMKEAQDSLDFDGEDGLVQQMLQRTDQRAKTVMRGLKTELRREESKTAHLMQQEGVDHEELLAVSFRTSLNGLRAAHEAKVQAGLSDMRGAHKAVAFSRLSQESIRRG